MGDSFNRVNENTAIADAIELIHMVLEAETLLFWRRKSGKKEFIQICSAVEELNTIDTLEMKKLENLRKEIGNFEDTINKNHKGVMTRLEETYALAVMWKNKKNAHR